MSRYARSVSYAAQFWARVDRSGGPDACWEWQGNRDPRGYRHANHAGNQGAHRVAYALACGHIPCGLVFAIGAIIRPAATLHTFCSARLAITGKMQKIVDDGNRVVGVYRMVQRERRSGGGRVAAQQRIRTPGTRQ